MKPERILAVLAAALLASGLAACRGTGSNADASTPPDGTKGPVSAGKGEYAGIKTGKVEKGDVSVMLPEVGTLSPVTKVEVKSVLSGRIIEILVKEGDLVKVGQPLAVLEPGVDQLRELSAIASGVQSAQLELKDARIDYDNAVELAAKGFASNDQLKAAEKRLRQAEITHGSAVAQRAALAQSGVPIGNAAAALKQFNVVSPANGAVLVRKVEVGEVASSALSSFNAGTVLFEIADATQLKVDAFVNEVDIGKVMVGYPVKITVDAFRGREFTGEVDTISPSARKEGEIRGFDVEVRLTGDIGPLRPGMTANLDIRGEERKDVVRLPVEALFKDKGEEVVWRIVDGKPERQKIAPGLISMEWIEVPEGLEPGTEIALERPTAFLEAKKDDGKRRGR